MNSKSMWQWLVLIIIVAFSVALTIPPKDKIRLGLDLKGGSSFTLELDKTAIETTVRERALQGDTEDEIQRRIDETMKTADDTAVEIIRKRIDSLGTEEPVITKSKKGRIYVQIPGATEEKRREAGELIRSVAFLEFRLVSTRSQELSAGLLAQGSAPQGYKTEVINGQNYYIRDPSVEAPAYASELFNFGNPPPGYVFMLEKVSIDGREAFHPIFVGRRPLLTGDTLSRAGTQMDAIGRNMVTLSFNAEGTAKFAEITTKYGPGGSANRGSREGRQLAIILDGIVESAPVINEAISGGNAVISGDFSTAKASSLRNVLNIGAMPAPLKLISQHNVDPTLGRDAVEGATKAIIVGFGAVLLFVIFYYRRLGVVAGIALILDLILLPACAIITSGFLGLFASDATISGGTALKLPVLTLPGIAGILLTIGMAVDANVLIYERTREEQERGRSPYQSIMAGYDRAFLAIFDGNLTTVITGVILFIYGTGLIRGFSVTLIAGIVASMYTALVVTKMIFKATVKESRTEPITMMSFLPEDLNIPFYKYFKKFGIFIVALIVVTLGITIVRGVKNPSDVFAVDFTGGAKLTFEVENPEKAPLEYIRNALSAADIKDADPQYQTLIAKATSPEDNSASNETPAVDEVASAEENTPEVEQTAEVATVAQDKEKTLLEIKLPVADNYDEKQINEEVLAALAKAPELQGAKFKPEGEAEFIGSQIGAEMRKSALIAITLSTIAMLIYITLRFEFGFAIGAIVALVCDVLVTVGVFGALGFQFDLTIVAALLTIVGYGVNDTIVLFDRIREELRKDQKMSFLELTNKCVNLTLNRTILTSASTMLTVMALIIFTTGNIYGFAVCIMIGLVESTFTTIFVASPVMLAWYRNKSPDLSGKKQ